MKIQRFAIGLTLLNLVVLILCVFRSSSAPSPEVPAVLRAHGLEIVDDQGRVRAMIKVFPATTGYPETVLLRLISSKGGPNVKIAATEDGWAVSFAGETNPAHIQLLSRGTNTYKAGQQRWA